MKNYRNFHFLHHQEISYRELKKTSVKLQREKFSQINRVNQFYLHFQFEKSNTFYLISHIKALFPFAQVDNINHTGT